MATGGPAPDDATTSVAAALAEARRRGLDRLDAQVLLGQVMQRERTWLLAHGEALLDHAQSTAWQAWFGRRAAGEPLAYLVGSKEFHGLDLQVDRRVLIPRPETEGLVDWALELATPRSAPRDGEHGKHGEHGETRPLRVVDLGTGSGAIAIALAVAARERGLAIDVHAGDVSDEALAVARANAARHAVAVEFRAGSWWAPWAGMRFDIAVSNPPYVADGDPHLPALRHEPLGALLAGADGLADLRQIVAEAPHHLDPGGWLLLEHGWDQAERVRDLLRTAGLGAVQTRSDLAGQPRCTGARTPRQAAALT